jgi:hypothetical protein
MNTWPVSTIPNPDGLVQWRGCPRGIPQRIAEGILSVVAIPSCGILKMKKVLEDFGCIISSDEIIVPQFDFKLSLDELTAIFEAEFGMNSKDAAASAASVFLQLNSGMVAKY